jgi:hypothetical protein
VTVRHEGVLQAVLERGVAMEVIPVAALEGQTTSLGRGRTVWPVAVPERRWSCVEEVVMVWWFAG